MRNLASFIFRARKSSVNVSGDLLLAISMPKCGTHLLDRLVAGLTGCERSEESMRTLSVCEAERILNRHENTQGRYLRGHQVYTFEIERMLSSRGVRIVFIIRDPRDLVVSHAHWVTSDQHGSQSNRLFYKSLSSLDQRIMTSICGRPEGWNEGKPSKDELISLQYHGVREHIGLRLGRYLPWLSCESVCTVKFERLVGSRGGGTAQMQEEEVRRVADFLGVELSPKAMSSLLGKIFDPSSKTFRRGQIGSWKEEFNELHKLVFKTVAGAELIELGYESGFDW